MTSLKGEQLEAMREADAKFIAKWKASGKPTVKYPCPHCKAEIERTCPSSRSETWDSLCTCPQCGGMYFFVIKGRKVEQLTAIDENGEPR